MSGSQYLVSLRTAVPPLSIGQEEAFAFLARRYGSSLRPRSLAVAEKLFRHPSVRSRRFAVDDPACLINEDQDSRMERFRRAAVSLAGEAVRGALAQAGLAPAEVTGLIVNTCTGYLCPGISTYLIEELGLPRDIFASDLVGSGCGGALPNHRLGQAFLASSPGGAVVSVSVEICSATFEMGDDLSLIVSNALFGDGAAASVIRDRPGGLVLEASMSRYVPEFREHIRYVYRGGRLHNQLSTQLPGIVGRAAAGVVRDLLALRGLSVADVPHWALHAGGEKIVAAVQSELSLAEHQLAPAREVLANYGNMSSPTVLFVLDRILARGIAPGERVVMLSFGAGLSIHAGLLRKL